MGLYVKRARGLNTRDLGRKSTYRCFKQQYWEVEEKKKKEKKVRPFTALVSPRTFLCINAGE